MLDIIKAVFWALVPPMEANPAELFRHRVAVAAMVGATSMGMVLHVAWACGFLAFTGFSGFALAADQQTVANEIRADRAEGFSRQLFDLREHQCRAINAHNAEAAESWGQQVHFTMEKLHDLTGRDPWLPTCSEFVN